jgi:4-alpha-glucanotransferase
MLRARHGEAIARYVFGQFVLHEQHRRARDHARALGLELWGDVQTGVSAGDAWGLQGLFLPGYRLGAPPSRTNPAGQAWNYPVLDPDQPAAVEHLVAARFSKAFTEYDGLRVDHPHGLVCPWVYRADTGDAAAAVRRGARLYGAPALPDHPELARFAIPRRDQLSPERGTRRWDDDWVRTLEAAQIDRYARLFDVVVDAARRHGHSTRALACEVLSTCPRPLQHVLARHRLGRFRVTQKADLGDPHDGYRSENADEADWIMVGTHDTLPLWAVVDAWRRAGTLGARAQYLAWRLAPSAHERLRLAERLAASPGRLAQAQFADLFASRARHVMVFFTDAFGLREPYNRPGTVDERNWSLRLPPDHVARYHARLATDEALNLPAALAMALHARGGDASLVARLESMAAALRSGAGVR